MKRKIVLILFLAFVFIFGSEINSIAEEGVTETEICIGDIGPLTGPGASWGNVMYGVDLLFKIINEEGGIEGRKIVHRIFDDGYNPSKTMLGVKELHENVGIFAWVTILGTENFLSVENYLNKRNVPVMTPLSGYDAFSNPPNKNIFTLYPLYSSEIRALCKYAIEKMGKKKIAIIYRDDEYGKTGLKSAENAVAKYGMQLAEKISFPTEGGNMKKCAEQLRQSEADTVLLWETPVNALRLLKIAKDINYNPQWMGGLSFCDFQMYYNLSRSLVKGLISIQLIDTTETPTLKKYKEALKKHFSEKLSWGTSVHGGILWFEPMIEALKKCGRDLTRERFISSLEQLGRFKGVGCPMYFRPFESGNPESRRAVTHFLLGECLENGEMKRLTDWIKVE